MLADVSDAVQPLPDYARRHVRFGWRALFVFAAIGLGLESLHGFKIAAYLDTSNETRRLMWRLAHAHGTVLSVINILAGLMAAAHQERARAFDRLASNCLIGATILLPAGFFLGGVNVGSRPVWDLLVVPIAAVLLLAALVSFAAARTERPDAARPQANQRRQR